MRLPKWPFSKVQKSWCLISNLVSSDCRGDTRSRGWDPVWFWGSVKGYLGALVSVLRTRPYNFINYFVDLKLRFPFYQDESTIFDKGNFLSKTPDTKNIFPCQRSGITSHLLGPKICLQVSVKWKLVQTNTFIKI